MAKKTMFAAALMFVGLLCLSVSALAQTAIPAGSTGVAYPSATSYPGSFRLAFGDQSPVEGGNIQLNSYFEQGATVYRHGFFSIVPYASLNFMTDTYGYDWNNNIQTNGGVKANFVLRHGIVTVGGAYSFEDRFKSGTLYSSPTYYVSDWFGWKNARVKTSRFPGDTWAIAGHITPIESGNYIFTTYVEQGVVAKRFHRVVIVPIAVGTFSKDTLGYSWNNYVRPGGGVDFVLPKGMDLLAVYLHETRSGHVSAGEFSLTLKIWRGWAFKGRS